MSASNLAPQLKFLATHPLGRVAERIGKFLGTGCDAVGLSLFLCRAASRARQPFNLTIVSSDPSAELAILDRIFGLACEGVTRVYTAHQCRILAESNFEDTEIAIVGDSRNALHDKLLEVTSRDSSMHVPPGVVRIAHTSFSREIVGPTLDLLVSAEERSLSGFCEAFSPFRYPCDDSRRKLSQILMTLGDGATPRCPFWEQIRVPLPATQKLLVSRLLATIASLRRVTSPSVRSTRPVLINLNDYRIARQLLVTLPVTGSHSGLSPYAAEYGEILYCLIQEESYQLSLPDMSDFGNKVFTRKIATDKLNVSYNTAKGCIDQLEKHGIIESRLISNTTKYSLTRDHGRQIYFRFAEGQKPPFGVRSPFECLPDL